MYILFANKALILNSLQVQDCFFPWKWFNSIEFNTFFTEVWPGCSIYDFSLIRSKRNQFWFIWYFFYPNYPEPELRTLKMCVCIILYLIWSLDHVFQNFLCLHMLLINCDSKSFESSKSFLSYFMNSCQKSLQLINLPALLHCSKHSRPFILHMNPTWCHIQLV